MVTSANEPLITANGRATTVAADELGNTVKEQAIAYNELVDSTFKRIADASVAAATREPIAREPMVEINGKEQHQGAMAMGGTSTGDPKLQVSTAVKSDFETGAKTALPCSKDGEAAHTARDLVSAISALPEKNPPGAGYSGYKPELKKGDIQAVPTSDIDRAFDYVKAAAAAAGKEGVDKMTPVLVDDDDDGTSGGTAGLRLKEVMPLRQMRGRITEALREPLRKLYESHHAAPHFEEHHAMWGVADQ